MFLLIPILVYLLGALALWFFSKISKKIGWIWMGSAAISLIPWLFLLIIPFRLLGPFGFENWLGDLIFNSPITFQLDSASWPYAFGLSGLILAIFLTAPIRHQLLDESPTLIGTLAISGVGLLSISSITPLAFVLTWTALDLLELVILTTSKDKWQLDFSAIVGFGFRLAGSLLVFLVLILSDSENQPEIINQIDSQYILIIILAVGFRVGVLPLHLPIIHVTLIQRGLGTVLRMVSLAASLVVLGHLPSIVSSGFFALLFMAIAIIASFYGAFMWASSSNELTGRSYILISLSSFSVICVLQGQPTAAVLWGIMVLLAGGILFLFSTRTTWALVVAGAGLIAISGLPFTPVGLGWIGLFGEQNHFIGYFFIFVLAVLQIGYLRHVLKQDQIDESQEPWVKFVYPVGLLSIVITQWLIYYRNITHTGILNYWWAGVAALCISLSLTTLLMSFRKKEIDFSSEWFVIVVRKIGKGISSFLELRWLFGMLFALLKMVENIVNLAILVLEGEGGLLWLLVALVIMATLIQSGGVP